MASFQRTEAVTGSGNAVTSPDAPQAFMTAQSGVLSISIPLTEAHVIRHFQERMPHGLFVPDVPTSL
jgi:hypothetical protein